MVDDSVPDAKMIPQFLNYRGHHINVNPDFLHDAPIEDLVKLRNTISVFRDMWKIYRENLREVFKMDIVEMHSDFKTLWLNPSVIGGVLDCINGHIARRNLAAIRKRRELKENKEK